MSFKNKVQNLLGTVIPTLGEKVQYRPKAGGSIIINAVFDNEYESVDPETEQLVSSNIPRIGIRLSDLSSPPEKGDKLVTEDGQTYKVTDPREDGQGGATLYLHKVKK